MIAEFFCNWTPIAYNIFLLANQRWQKTHLLVRLFVNFYFIPLHSESSVKIFEETVLLFKLINACVQMTCVLNATFLQAACHKWNWTGLCNTDKPTLTSLGKTHASVVPSPQTVVFDALLAPTHTLAIQVYVFNLTFLKSGLFICSLNIYY